MLRLYGYTEERPDGLSFPGGQEEPDEYQVAIVTLEVLLLRTELNLLLQVRWPCDPKVLSAILGAPPNASHFESPHAGEFCCCSSLEGSFCYTFSLWNVRGWGLRGELGSRWEFFESSLQNTHPRQNALDQLLRDSVEDDVRMAERVLLNQGNRVYGVLCPPTCTFSAFLLRCCSFQSFTPF